jgi:lysophospholipase L1-like esterase
VSVIVVAASCKAREPVPEATPKAAPAPPASVASAAPPVAGSDAGGPMPAPKVTGAPRTKEYPWMSVATWREKHEALVARAKKGHIDLLFLGDSITEGWQDNAVWQAHYARRNAANFGIGGDTVENLLWRIDHGEVEGLAPKVAVVLIGTNNLGLSGDAPGDVGPKIEAFVAELRAKLPSTKLLLLAVFPRGALPDNPMRAQIKEVNARIARLDDGGAVRFLDLGPILLNKDGSLSKEVAPDFLHLSEKGYAAWAEGMEPLLAAMLRG